MWERKKQWEAGRWSILFVLFLSFRSIFVTFWQKMSSEHILLRTFFLEHILAIRGYLGAYFIKFPKETDLSNDIYLFFFFFFTLYIVVIFYLVVLFFLAIFNVIFHGYCSFSYWWMFSKTPLSLSPPSTSGQLTSLPQIFFRRRVLSIS